MRQRKIDGLSVVVFILALLVIGSSTATVLLCIHRFVGITEKVFLWYLVGITGPGSVIVTAYVTVCIHKQKNSKLLFWLGKNYPKLTIVWVMMIYTTVSLGNTVSWTVEQVYNALSLQWTIFGLSMAIFLVWDGIVGDFLKSKQPRKPDQDDKMEKYKFLLKKQSFSGDVGLQMYDLDMYHRFVTGNDSTPMKKILMGIGILECAPFLTRGESLIHNGEDIEIRDESGVKLVKVADRLEEIYQAIFGRKDVFGDRTKYIGMMRFTDRTRSYVEGITAMLFPGANYD